MCSARCQLAHFIVLHRQNKTRPRAYKQINVDFSPPPSVLLQPVCALGPRVWQLLEVAASGHLGDWRVGDLGHLDSQLPALAWLAPFSGVLLPGPSAAVLLGGDHFYLDLLWVCVCVCGGVAGDFSPSLPPTPLFAPSVSLGPVAVSLDWSKGVAKK